jgi:hypothetical protein
MPAGYEKFEQLINAALVNTSFDVAVGPFKTATVQIVDECNGGAATAKFAVQRSLNGKDFGALPTPVALIGAGITNPFDVTCAATLRVTVSTAVSTSPKNVRAIVWLKA